MGLAPLTIPEILSAAAALKRKGAPVCQVPGCRPLQTEPTRYYRVRPMCGAHDCAFFSVRGLAQPTPAYNPAPSALLACRSSRYVDIMRLARSWYWRAMQCASASR